MSKKSMKQFNERKTAQKPMQNAQPKKVKKREIEAWILAIFMIAWTVCSVLGTIGFCRTQASADSVDAVDTVSVIDEKAVECSTAYSSKRVMSSADNTYIPEYHFNVDILTSMVFPDELDEYSTFAGVWSIDCVTTNYELSYTYNDVVTTFDLLDDTTNSITYYQLVENSQPYIMHGSAYIYALTAPYGSSNADFLSTLPDFRLFYPRQFKIDYLGYGFGEQGGVLLQLTIEFYNMNSGVSQYNYIIIDTDFINNTADFIFTSRGILNDMPFVPIYGLQFDYVANGGVFNNGYNTGYEEGYQCGKVVGRDEGRDIGYDEGYSNGRRQGYNEGRADGFTQGVASANEYTFAGLIGAVFDAPIQAFQGLFSFDVLGVDLSGFLLSLLTCAIALSIIKLII